MTFLPPPKNLCDCDLPHLHFRCLHPLFSSSELPLSSCLFWQHLRSVHSHPRFSH